MANDNQTNQPNQNDQQAGSTGDPNANDFTANENALGSDPNTRPERDTNTEENADGQS